MKRILAIGFIWGMCSLAWLVLGTTLVHRSGETDYALREEVQGLWGPMLTQAPPHATHPEVITHEETVEETDAQGRTVTRRVRREETVQRTVPLVSTDATARLELTHRRKGLLWFPTYTVAFDGWYGFRNPTPWEQHVTLTFPLFGVSSVIYDGFAVTGEDGKVQEPAIGPDGARWDVVFAPGEVRRFRVGYRSRGTTQWSYRSDDGAGVGGNGLEVRDFRLAVSTNTPDVDFPAGTLSPTRHAAEDGVWQGEWTFESLVSGSGIAVVLPGRLNPGPLASAITFFAPVSLLFFFFVVAILALARRRPLHPMHYFFLGAAFFAFHLLFAYLVDHVHVGPAFAASALVSVALVVTYARLFTGWRFALRVMGTAQLLYLVLFSASFFLDGFTGLAVTVGAVLTLFVTMQLTGRLDWNEVFRPPPHAATPAALSPTPAPAPAPPDPEVYPRP